MSIIVQKYGGSSVADVERLQRVARKIVATREAGHDVVAVVSAMGNTTDELLERARTINAHPDRRELDMLLSVGERISMTLLSMAVHALGHEAISFTGSQVGIITNDAHSNARIIDVRPFRIQDELARGRVVIVAGYQGTSYKREVTTLGRGGSDMTAVALAGALSAQACEIYSDVDGVFTTDPRVVLDAARLDAVTADEMLELARHGASVLHAEAVAWARKHRIALYARSTHAAESRGTVVRPDGWPDTALSASRVAPRGLASLPAVIDLRAPAACLGLLDGTTLLELQLDGDQLRAVLDPTNGSRDLGHACAELRRRLGARCEQKHELEVSAEVTNITWVGQDIGRDPAWVARCAASLRDVGIEPTRVSASQHRVTALVPVAVRAAAMTAAHALVELG